MKSKKTTKNINMTNYPVGDFLIRIKNAKMAGKKDIRTPKTKLILNLAKKLQKIGLLDEVAERENMLDMRLKFFKKEPLLTDLKLVSKPGLRVYKEVRELEKIKSPYIYIVSTSKGLMTKKEAIKRRLGGEVIVKIL